LAAEQLGPVHPIVEPDMLEEIHRVLREKQKSGELARLQKEGIARSKRSIENPRPVEGLVRADRNRTFYFDPSFRVPETIKDSEGRVVAEAGKVVKPPRRRLYSFFEASRASSVRGGLLMKQ